MSTKLNKFLSNINTNDCDAIIIYDNTGYGQVYKPKNTEGSIAVISLQKSGNYKISECEFSERKDGLDGIKKLKKTLIGDPSFINEGISSNRYPAKEPNFIECNGKPTDEFIKANFIDPFINTKALFFINTKHIGSSKDCRTIIEFTGKTINSGFHKTAKELPDTLENGINILFQSKADKGVHLTFSFPYAKTGSCENFKRSVSILNGTTPTRSKLAH